MSPDTTEYQGELTTKQRRRVEALLAARRVLHTSGPFSQGGTEAEAVIVVAVYIMTGETP